MNTYTWKLSKEKLNNTNLYLYSNFIKQVFKIDTQNDFNKIWKWSVENPQNFWKSKKNSCRKNSQKISRSS